jgi:hypothetical protein
VLGAQYVRLASANIPTAAQIVLIPNAQIELQIVLTTGLLVDQSAHTLEHCEVAPVALKTEVSHKFAISARISPETEDSSWLTAEVDNMI